jgi:hypothetical protein
MQVQQQRQAVQDVQNGRHITHPAPARLGVPFPNGGRSE